MFLGHLLTCPAIFELSYLSLYNPGIKYVEFCKSQDIYDVLHWIIKVDVLFLSCVIVTGH